MPVKIEYSPHDSPIPFNNSGGLGLGGIGTINTNTNNNNNSINNNTNMNMNIMNNINNNNNNINIINNNNQMDCSSSSASLWGDLDHDFFNDSQLFCDDIFNSFIPTPPQSPPRSKILEDFLEERLDDELMPLAHDCMWNGRCQEGMCKKRYSNMPPIRSITPFKFWENSYPEQHINYNDECYSVDDISITSGTSPPSQQSQLSPQPNQQQQQESSNSVAIAMANDHSYGSNGCSLAHKQKQQIQSNTNTKVTRRETIKIKKEALEDEEEDTKDTNLVRKDNSLIKINQKAAKKRYSSTSTNNKNNKRAASSISRNVISSSSSSSSNGTKSSTNDNILAPTIISVSSFKNIHHEPTMHAKYKVSIKKQKLSMNHTNNTTATINSFNSSSNSSFSNSSNSSKSNNSVVINSHPIIQIKNLKNNHSINNHISTTTTTRTANIIRPQITRIKSPPASDSEESSISSMSNNDVNMLGDKASPPVKRREHNDSERKRRDHLRNSFNNLRDQVPKLKESDKRPPRILILHEATQYVKELIEQHEELEEILKEEYEKNIRLKELLKMNGGGHLFNN